MAVGFWGLVGFWLVKVLILALICFLLGWLGLRALDALTPRIHEREEIGKDPIATGLFISGFLIYVALVIHGAVTTLPGGSFVGSLFMRRLGIIAIAFVVSLLLAIGIFNLLDRLTPQIPFAKLRHSSLGTGLYVFGYLIFLGLITNAAFAAAF
ncbi:hypothetical protein AKJ44_01165 [candidate division MSBL1 archaeon SCGC-AAA261F17]|uniref:DUF350 domain-containing protein n=1 Tax=candidate division MSBL1 archaeon SCGC-AAA261F17 TaxID=1698274 RepID=A0A133V6Y7_9EURY|nr:hypothetical protein AKJ44_01165 [candidate division MSBL1 archaeon SCGC-AAA261F17]